MAASSRCWRPTTGASSSPARRTSPWTPRRCRGGAAAAPGAAAPRMRWVPPPVTAIQGATIQDVRRRGKLALFDLSGALVMIIHPKRDGRLAIAPSTQRATKDVALILQLDGGEDLRLMELGPKKGAGLYGRRGGGGEQAEPVGGLGGGAV